VHTYATAAPLISALYCARRCVVIAEFQCVLSCVTTLTSGFWHSDKRPVQTELAVNLSKLVRDVPREKQTEWIGAFYSIMLMYWDRLDRARYRRGFLDYITHTLADYY
jgi:hypothetical protein